ncbi:CehA/McbA family metallohydrolase [Chondromyces crocatus]|uniref:Polymerase/histidinol phosphatase N-terminal domain-containing protein n=1 Tax=Chondromyces crocatus TaxID=52 RepID=A0A0K1EMB3_CHOCO|nr:CehA/McbA family metallohydrolase [Chondromyces crocatus]AKT42045.1 uncharacterized protein CMC5_062680 [Chondromyces crocatus]
MSHSSRPAPSTSLRPVPSTASVLEESNTRPRKRRLRFAVAGVALTTLLIGGFMIRRVESSEAPDLAREQLPTTPPRFAEQLDVSVFQRGNLHTHSARTDGDSPAQLVAAWYRNHGYQFLALTDHNSFMDGARPPETQEHDFVLIPGEEITMIAASQPVHVNALCTKERIGGGTFRTPGAALSWATSKILEQDGIALVNHPNFHWALEPEHIAEAKGAQLLEIFSGHPHVRSDGDATHTSAESKWEHMISSGHAMAAVAVDDMHALNPTSKNVPQAGPGIAWVEVFAEETSQEAICAALKAGQLYASAGPRIKRLTVSGDELSIELPSADIKVEFLDRWGLLLAIEPPTPTEQGTAYRSTYRLRGPEHYVRARLTAPNGTRAWTQPYWVTR